MAEALPSMAEHGARIDPSPGLHLSITPVPPWSPFCTMCLTCLLSPSAAQTQSTVLPGECCCLLTLGCPLPSVTSWAPNQEPQEGTVEVFHLSVPALVTLVHKTVQMSQTEASSGLAQ